MIDFHAMFFGDQPPIFFLEILIRTVIMSLYTLVVIRLVGGRGTGFGEFSIFEFLLLVLLGSAAGDPMFSPDVPLLHGMFAILVVACVWRVLLTLISHYRRAERLLEGDPIRLVRNGLLDMRNLYRARVSASEVFMQLRQQGFDNLGQVAFAFLEPDGVISAFPVSKPSEEPSLPLIPDEEHHQRHAGQRAGSDQAMACMTCGHCMPVSHDLVLPACPRCKDKQWTAARRVDHLPAGMGQAG
jgi:uncharacterized membrane protein YcaP (DUF421 family)